MDALDVAILALRLVVVALLYGFLFVVVQTAWRGLRARPVASSVVPGRSTNAETPPTRLRLVVLEAGGAALKRGQAIEVADGAVLGRAERADVVLADQAVSSAHARLQRAGHGWVVADLGSTNGTRLNGSPLPSRSETRLAAGDVLALGNVQLQVAAR